ncbi:5-deoxy-glucuronate isomerase [Paraburkholderia sp. Ac-20347]|uniref:5-deoxy-glucuronate isomerase n=1 Tax=Paraburkholderia sp. Ac-20347 TaxID=2703892 RepID=UPI00197FFE81|nr:5-deoxy-glucuronate isomerase [Paraburkholderia sp. Ac-20347]MBN3807648.1 5-deoxy-glucuronate isomerase [Paraburkholderia sp. Ac-20347]
MTISPLLVKASSQREICNVTPESAGWQHVGFRALRLKAGDHEVIATGSRELCVVVLTGTIRAEVDGEVFDDLGTRDSVFDAVSPDALYAPASKTVTITATRDSEVALCTAPGVSPDKPVQRLEGARMRRMTRGEGTNTRHVCDILMGDNPAADRLLVVEVITPASHSSSYPPHKHDTDAAPTETVLEETYYHRIDPPQGFGFQRVYTDDRSLDEACVIENHDVVLVPRGYHPVVAPHGYNLYYLNVMAGPSRSWAFKNDPAHEWMLQPQASN